MRTILAIVLLSVTSLALRGQQPDPAVAQREAMRKLNFLAGSWSGPITVTRGPGEPIHLTQSEKVEYKLDGLILIIEGRSTGEDGSVPFQALATVAYDDASHTYRMRAYNAGHYTDAELTLLDDGFSWGFEAGPAHGATPVARDQRSFLRQQSSTGDRGNAADPTPMTESREMRRMAMEPEMSPRDLGERLDLIEAMIAEGRRQTESWGWTFLLWGIAYYAAMAWASWGQGVTILGGRVVAWPVTMMVAVLVTFVIAKRKRSRGPGTAVGRAVGHLWVAIGITMLLLIPALGFSGRLDPNLFVSVVAGILGIAHGASGLILRWKAQLACAVGWWATCAAAPFLSPASLIVGFLSAIFLCQILFGFYAMSLDARRHSPDGAVHA